MTNEYFLFDCETGGLTTDLSLLTLSGYILDEKFRIIDNIDLFVKPDDGVYKLNAKAMEINKINLVAHDAMAEPESVCRLKLEAFLQKHGVGKLTPAGHNVAMDIQFAKKLLPSFGKYVTHRTYDTASLGKFACNVGIIEHSDFSLQSLCEAFGIDTKGQHNAKVDIELTRQVLVELHWRARRDRKE
ncbi:MAG: hypothetical protein E6R04_11365 [Spirochaetes bacterium]|nr:MAG: hypothetical protein E6R04_11365 [Spirochaetota bacterium]